MEICNIEKLRRKSANSKNFSRKFAIFPLFNHIAMSEKTVSAAPPDWWWIVIAAIDALMDLINSVFHKLQAPSLLVSTQTALIASLAVDIATMIGIRLRDVEDVEVSEGFI